MSPADSRHYPTSAERVKVVSAPSPAPHRHADRHHARVLDPALALRLPEQTPPQPTVYVGNRLLLRDTTPDGAALRALREAAARKGLKAELDPIDTRLLELAGQADLPASRAQPLLARVRLRLATAAERDGDPEFEAARRHHDGRLPSAAVAPPDAWSVLQEFRADLPEDDALIHDVHLDHLLHATPVAIGGVPLTSGHSVAGVPLTSGHGTGGLPLTSGHSAPNQAAEFALPGRGGRGPVAWVGREPHRRPDAEVGRRPVVAILDTGVGSHPWLPESIVDRSPLVKGLPIGLSDPATDAETNGGSDNPLVGDLEADSGHGTFIAGLLRQTCPDADLLSVRIMHGDGLVAEGDLIESLNQLWLRQLHAIADDDVSQIVDIVSLSLGYYHEDPADARFDPLLLTPLRGLGELGVAVVVSAGNDATLRPMYPAAFAPYPDGPFGPAARGAIPVTAVGALNPGGTVAMFSNEGPWVSFKRPGSALVSTFPTDFDASGQPTSRTTYADEIRETLDCDDFRSGFGTWSGTSFAAPILAGELAQAMLDGGAELTDLSPVATRRRMKAALQRVKAADEARTTRRAAPHSSANGHHPPKPTA